MNSYGVAGVASEAIEELGHRVRDLIETLAYNLKMPKQPRLCETALTLDVDPRWLPILRNTLKRRTQAFIAAINEDLHNLKMRRKGSATPPVRIGLSVFSFEDEKVGVTWAPTAARPRAKLKKRRADS